MVKAHLVAKVNPVCAFWLISRICLYLYIYLYIKDIFIHIYIYVYTLYISIHMYTSVLSKKDHVLICSFLYRLSRGNYNDPCLEVERCLGIWGNHPLL